MSLNAFNKTPKVICKTPIMTEIFIFRLFVKFKLFLATDQTGSIPKGYVQSVDNLYREWP